MRPREQGRVQMRRLLVHLGDAVERARRNLGLLVGDERIHDLDVAEVDQRLAQGFGHLRAAREHEPVGARALAGDLGQVHFAERLGVAQDGLGDVDLVQRQRAQNLARRIGRARKPGRGLGAHRALHEAHEIDENAVEPRLLLGRELAYGQRGEIGHALEERLAGRGRARARERLHRLDVAQDRLGLVFLLMADSRFGLALSVLTRRPARMVGRRLRNR